MDYANRIKNLRLALGLSQRELAQKFNVRHTAISQWESGARKISGPAVVLLEMLEKEVEAGRVERKKTLKKIQANAVMRTLEATKAISSAAVQTSGTTLVGMLSQFESGQALERKMWESVGNNLVDKLGEFKGLYMKLGQMLSYLPFVLPEESRARLASLQSDSTPLDPAVIHQVVTEQLGKPPQQIFAEWNDMPFSAASIGQVHRARLSSGETVAVKVQYPKIKQAIKADLANALLVELVINVIYRKQARGTLLKEMKERFLQECDYTLEATHQERFRELFIRHPRIKVPRVYRELSTPLILVSEFCEGQSYAEFTNSATPEKREWAGEALYHFAYESVFKHRLFNCDPHPGNYLFGDERVTFLDFGCARSFSAKFIDRWRRQQLAILEQRDRDIDEITVEMGLVSDRDKFDFDYHRQIIKVVAQPILEGETFRFTPEFVEKTWRLLVLENPNRHYMNLPGEWLFTNRLQWGLFSILAGLKADIPCRRLFLSAMERKSAGETSP